MTEKMVCGCACLRISLHKTILIMHCNSLSNLQGYCMPWCYRSHWHVLHEIHINSQSLCARPCISSCFALSGASRGWFTTWVSRLAPMRGSCQRWGRQRDSARFPTPICLQTDDARHSALQISSDFQDSKFLNSKALHFVLCDLHPCVKVTLERPNSCFPKCWRRVWARIRKALVAWRKVCWALIFLLLLDFLPCQCLIAPRATSECLRKDDRSSGQDGKPVCCRVLV